MVPSWASPTAQRRRASRRAASSLPHRTGDGRAPRPDAPVSGSGARGGRRPCESRPAPVRSYGLVPPGRPGARDSRPRGTRDRPRRRYAWCRRRHRNPAARTRRPGRCRGTAGPHSCRTGAAGPLGAAGGGGRRTPAPRGRRAKARGAGGSGCRWATARPARPAAPIAGRAGRAVRRTGTAARRRAFRRCRQRLRPSSDRAGRASSPAASSAPIRDHRSAPALPSRTSVCAARPSPRGGTPSDAVG